MRLDLNTPLQLELPAARAGSPPAKLENGQTLQARVEQQGERLLLRVAGRQLPAPANSGLKAGQLVQLRVEQQAERTLLTLVEQAGTRNSRELLQQALRQLLPQQGSRTPLNTPAQALAAAQAETTQLPAPLQQALNALLSALPRASDLQNPQGLRQALQHSGLFTESSLARPRPGQSLGQDLKATALRLMLQLQPGKGGGGTPGGAAAPTADLALSLLTQTEHLLSRLQQLQVHNAGAETGRLDLAVELPLRHDQGLDLLQLRLRQEDEAPAGDADGGREADTEDGARPISIQVAFRFEGLGPVQARLRLRGEHVSASWWAERAETAALFQTHQARLRTQLEGLGLTVDALGLQSTRPPGPLDDLHRDARGLLHEKA
ncbi:flagellar hook-length control protein FliK [Alkalilimnicola sp. S0819]|uniref:flagellar hook-length control protein FliK n=1 Tax=Alkalilimnicola sp. S0819 TaxID=2613922 RepID=UPI0012616B4C|nr:flagellar hook-length control protein FliK [Alkalilimnicola sp. S0819]KAB7627154.1 flagellar hook-length control protein FliK [Alkalilimnicola sp. S0819]MPQ15863.1 hypothetical protein [Alkalilimnicola sp. S0819]